MTQVITRSTLKKLDAEIMLTGVGSSRLLSDEVAFPIDVSTLCCNISSKCDHTIIA